MQNCIIMKKCATGGGDKEGMGIPTECILIINL